MGGVLYNMNFYGHLQVPWKGGCNLRLGKRMLVRENARRVRILFKQV